MPYYFIDIFTELEVPYDLKVVRADNEHRAVDIALDWLARNDQQFSDIMFKYWGQSSKPYALRTIRDKVKSVYTLTVIFKGFEPVDKEPERTMLHYNPYLNLLTPLGDILNKGYKMTDMVVIETKLAVNNHRFFAVNKSLFVGVKTPDICDSLSR